MNSLSFTLINVRDAHAIRFVIIDKRLVDKFIFNAIMKILNRE